MTSISLKVVRISLTIYVRIIGTIDRAVMVEWLQAVVGPEIIGEKL